MGIEPGGDVRTEAADLRTWAADAAVALEAAHAEWSTGDTTLPLTWVGHSFGGQVLAFVDHTLIDRLIVVATGQGHWRHNPPRLRRRIRAFWHVVVPTIRPVTIFLLVWGLIDVFQFFDLVYTTTKGGPLNSTLTLVYYIWELAFNFFTAGYGAAVAYVLFFTSLIVTIAALVYGRRNRVAL